MKDIVIWILIGIIFFLIIKQNRDEKKTKGYYDTSKQELKELFYTSEEMLQELEDLSEKLLKNLDIKYKEINTVLQRVKGYSTNKIDGPPKNQDVGCLQIKAMDDIPLTDRHFQVHELYRKGYNLTHIARTLNMGKGEVKLILNMDKTADERKYKGTENGK